MKERYIFEGRVIPERVDANFPLTSFDRFSLQICKSKIFIVAELIRDEIPNFKNGLHSRIGDIINYLGFLSVTAMSYEIDSLINTNTGEVIVFGTDGFVFDEEISGLDGQFEFRKINPETPIEIDLNLVFNPIVARAAFELRNAIRHHDFTAMHCQLAIEAIRNHFCSNFERKNWERDAWASMRKSLNIDEGCLKLFHEVATDQRHGRNREQTWAQRKLCMQIGWETLHRFMCFLGNEEVSLCITTYPMLCQKE